VFHTNNATFVVVDRLRFIVGPPMLDRFCRENFVFFLLGTGTGRERKEHVSSTLVYVAAAKGKLCDFTSVRD